MQPPSPNHIHTITVTYSHLHNHNYYHSIIPLTQSPFNHHQLALTCFPLSTCTTSVTHLHLHITISSACPWVIMWAQSPSPTHTAHNHHYIDHHNHICTITLAQHHSWYHSVTTNHNITSSPLNHCHYVISISPSPSPHHPPLNHDHSTTTITTITHSCPHNCHCFLAPA